MAQSNDTTNTNPPHSKFPPLTLDTTLADLLSQESPGPVKEALCNFKPCANPDDTTVPLNKKYLITSSGTIFGADLAHLQLENVSHLLSFWAGSMDVVLMACEGWSDDDTLSGEVMERNATRAFAVLGEGQRPRVRTFRNCDDLIRGYSNEHSAVKIRWGFAVDFAEQMPCFVHPEVQYRLNTKRWLAECPLRSANDEIIDPGCRCAEHTTRQGLWYFGAGCATCEAAVESEIARLKGILERTEPPFVLKITQSLGSVGTMIVEDEKDREETIEEIMGIQRDTLPLVTSENAHIYPVSLVLSEFLPGDTNALNFFVRRDGSVRFMEACHQLSTRKSGIQHTALKWDDQDELEAKFRDTLDDIGRVLHGEGYFGPAGADVMETEDGTQYVIDLNVRSSTSLVLGCLKGHCMKRGFNACGVYECMVLSVPREELERRFEREFEEGRFILLGGTRLGKKDVWTYPVVLAGEDQDAIKDLGARILEFRADDSKDTEDAGGG